MHTPTPISWAFQPSQHLAEELDELENVVKEFQAGVISESEFRSIRVPAGIYEQRESGTYMLRVRAPGGGILPEQLQRLGHVSATWGNKVLHVTTRQEFQIHRVPPEAILPALRSLAEAGLSCKGGGGNTVRNITSCFESGVCAREIFDVTPYAVATTERLLADPVSFQLPRKYKVAFSACERDCAGATIHDVGFIARVKDGVEGFAVYVAGGLGSKSRVASLLHEFIPAGDTFLVAEAVKRVFDKNGDRRNKHLARLRFLFERLAAETFRALYETELAALRASSPEPLEIRPFPKAGPAVASGRPLPSRTSAPAFYRWFDGNVRTQKQPGFFLVNIPLTVGDLPADVAEGLSRVVASHGDGILHGTQSQNVALHWVSESGLADLFDKLDALGLAAPEVPVLRDLVACAGASTCRLGICLSRGLAKAVHQELTDSEIPLENLGDLSIHVSGCPNSCGRHPIANIGFSGGARRVDDRSVPYYSLHLGGRLDEGKTRLGKPLGAIPARNAPALVRNLLTAWQASPEASDFHRFVDNGGQEIARKLLDEHGQSPLFKPDEKFFYDWDADKPFSLSGRGSGECSAGVFDLIEVDLANAREALEAGRLYVAALSASRALLITQSLKAKNDAEVFAQFQSGFIGAGLVDADLAGVVAEGLRSAAAPEPEAAFSGISGEVTALVATVRVLYENLDSSLRFKAPGA
ncbi:MAG: hypothetical protein ACOYM3_00465 [Terrimicrobiaceae bacterium]